jgi:hypothetical protein
MTSQYANLGGKYALDVVTPPSLLAAHGITDPIGDFRPYTDMVANTGASKQLLLGRPVATWHWGHLEQFEMDYLLSFVLSGSRQVYIKTRVASGNSVTYTAFLAIMQYPSKMTPKPGGYWEDVEIVFNNLVAS